MGPARRRLVAVSPDNPRDLAAARTLRRAGWQWYEGSSRPDPKGWYKGDDPNFPPGGPSPVVTDPRTTRR